MPTTENAGDSKKCSNQGLVFVLLLFIGFVVGLVTGFMTKDAVMLRLERAMHAAIANDKDDTKPIPAVATPGVTEAQPPKTAPVSDDKKKDEEKNKETEKKTEGDAKPAE